ncbi:hypothetical protein M1B35_10120 [Pseudomonas sp. MAFF 302046]|uniref:Uncharacterized protein n=1 Tax=Pseudomonas morbosilactucae TaxID=2938197 RepID=A0ABT0JF58_9PSED|nr:hypothetical protein [Pseudomonas morbosilactucae]MCK9814476.1 hypothetical protein [Pseudomonas morbosilactucae]
MDRYRIGHSLSAHERALTNLYIESGIRLLRDAYQALTEISIRQRTIEELRPSLSDTQIQDIESRYLSLSRNAIYQTRRLEDCGLADIRKMSLDQLANILAEIESLCGYLDISVTDLNNADSEADDFIKVSRVSVQTGRHKIEAVMEERPLDHLSN